MKTVVYSVPNISCKHCVHTINSELSELEGVRNVEAVESTKMVSVTFEPPATEEKIVSLLKELEYPPEE